MDVESQATINEAIDRLRDEIAAPVLAEVAALRAELSKLVELVGAFEGVTATLNWKDQMAGKHDA